MEDNNILTAERSLQIITEQIERSRQMVAKDTGELLYISGLCMICIAILIGLCIYFTGNMAFYIMYILLPAIIYGADRFVKRNKPQVPVSFVGYLVDKTWYTFGTFALLYFVLFNLYPFVMGQQSAENLLQLNITPFRTIILLMGMTIAINGHILKQKWMVVFGIFSGIGGFVWEMFNMTQGLLGWLGLDTSDKGIAYGMIPNIMIAIIAFVGLMLPGWILKKQP
jgi:hypothetical protein